MIGEKLRCLDHLSFIHKYLLEKEFEWINNIIDRKMDVCKHWLIVLKKENNRL